MLTRGAYIIDPRTGSAEAWLPPDDPPADPLFVAAISPNARYVWYLDRMVGEELPVLHLLDTSTGTLRRSSIPWRTMAGGSVFTPDFSRLLLVDETGMWIMRTSDGAVEASFPLGAPGNEPSLLQSSWSPDAGVAFVGFVTRGPDGAFTDGRVVRIDVSAGRVADAAYGLAVRGWSPDSRSYYVARATTLEARDADDGTLLWIFDLGMSGIDGVGQNEVAFEFLGFASDGSSMALRVLGLMTSDERSLSPLVVLDPATGELRYWIEGASSCGSGWAADGAALHVVGSPDGGDFRDFVVEGDGSDLRPLARPGAPGLEAMVSLFDDRMAAALPYGDGPRILSFFDPRDGSPISEVRMDGVAAAPALTWLEDGRVALTAPIANPEGCGFGPELVPLRVRFP